ncbi:hypothetical protein Q7P37_009738 [Cladosporium fusiforme]
MPKFEKLSQTRTSSRCPQPYEVEEAHAGCSKTRAPNSPNAAMAQTTVETRLEDALGEFQGKLTPPERARLQSLRAVPGASDVMVFTAELDAANAKRKTRSVASRLIKLLESIQQFSGIVGTFVSSNPALAALLPGWISLVRNAWVTFDSEFEEIRDRLEEMRYEVEGEIRLASDRASSKERETQGSHRRDMVLFTKRNDNTLAKVRNQDLRRLAHEKRTERDRLLERLSEHDQNTAYSQASSKCCAVGCGKSVLMSQVVKHLYQTCPTSDVRKVYFFCRFNDKASILADTILRSLLRQCLDASSLPKDIESELVNLLRQTWVDSSALFGILKSAISQYHAVYMIIDGIDECDTPQRSIILKSLSKLIDSSSGIVKLALASRNTVARPLEKSSTRILDINTRQQQFQEDVGTFIDETLALRIGDDDFHVGDQDVVIEVREALLSGAKGMFLWVALQLDDICRQTSDESIRLTVRHLPKDLRETYARMLSRIQLDEKASLALQAFKWVAVSQRPLTLPELTEALAIERFTKFSRPERMVNDQSRIIPWCEGLLMLHEDGEIQFAHPTVKEALTGDRKLSGVGNFSFILLEADKEVGELCVTYLNFNDFKTQLVKASKPRHLLAHTVIESSLSANINKGLAKALLKLSRMRSRSSRDSLDVLRPLIQAQPDGNGNPSITTAVHHPFLAYASKHWLAHSRNFQQNDRIWSLWHRMATEDESLAFKPSTSYDWTQNKRIISSCIIRFDHIALFRVVFHVDDTADHREIAWLLESAAHTGHVALVGAVLDLGFNQKWTLNRALQAAAEGGHLNVVERLLAAKSEVNAAAAKYSGRTALQAAAEGGHLDAVEALLAAKAGVNAAAAEYSGRTALQAAAEGGHLDVVETLLTAKAEVNAAAARSSSRTALQAAAEGGHLDVVEVLKSYGAK